MSVTLTPEAKKGLKEYSTQLVKSYGLDSVDDLQHEFSVTSPMETKLKRALLDSVEFLRMITTMDVEQIKGQVVKVGNYDIATGRKKGGRFVSDQGVDGHKYELVETDSCSVVTWAMLAAWANSGNTNEFMRMMSENATTRFALDILRIGFNGVSVEDTTDPKANPLGEDVNKGWHEIVKDEAPEQIMTDTIYFNPDRVGACPPGEYKTLDAIVTEIKNNLIHPSLRNHPQLSALVGSDLTSAAQTKLMNQADKPSERVSAQMMDKNIGGLPAYTPAFFPSKRIVVTIPSNLHALTQRGTRKRIAENVQDRKQYEDKYLRFEGYGIEEFKAYGAVDELSIVIGPKPEE